MSPSALRIFLSEAFGWDKLLILKPFHKYNLTNWIISLYFLWCNYSTVPNLICFMKLRIRFLFLWYWSQKPFNATALSQPGFSSQQHANFMQLMVSLNATKKTQQKLFLLQVSRFFYFQTERTLPNTTKVWGDLKQCIEKQNYNLSGGF